MKRYKLYKKVEPLCFNFEELLSYLILPLVIACYVSYPVLYFFGPTATIIFNIILAFVVTYFYKGLKRFITILNAKSVYFRFVSFLIVLVVLLIANFGFYLLVLYQKNNEFNVFYFYAWLLILFGLPGLYYTLKMGLYYYTKKQQSIDFINIILAINHDLDFFMAISNIQFINTANKNSSDLKIKNNIRHYSQKEFLAMKTKTRSYYANKEGFREQVQIPFNSNMLLLSWFSYVEDKYFSIEIAFPFEKFIKEQEKNQTGKFKVFRGKETCPLYLHFYPNGGIKFFYRDAILIDCPENKERLITEEQKEYFFEKQYNN